MEPETLDFNFDSTCTSPYISAPSSPQHFISPTFFFSAPASPTHISALNGDANVTHDDDVDDLEFEFSGHELEKNAVPAPADELFDGGKIKLKTIISFESSKSPIKEVDEVGKDDARGRERSSSSSRHKKTRSLSPLRVSDLLLIDDSDENISNQEKTNVSSLISLWNKTWKLKDLLLFRSASESRASSSTEELKKYEFVKSARLEEVKKAGLSSRRKRRETISAHELHYKMKREVLREMKNKTFLPYKQGLLNWHGCYGLDDTISMYMTRPQ